MSYRKTWQRLNALPEEEKVLASGVYIFWNYGKKECGCVLGKALKTVYENDRIFYPASGILTSSILILSGNRFEKFRSGFWNEYDNETIMKLRQQLTAEMDELGLSALEAANVQAYNDTCIPDPMTLDDSNSLETRHLRFKMVMTWMADRDIQRGLGHPSST